jgi:cytochrome c oxidase subunit 2
MVVLMVAMTRGSSYVRRFMMVTAAMMTLAVGTGSRWVGAQEREVVEIVAERFTFTPSEIVVTVGTTLELRVRSDDTMHGFRIVGRNVNIAVPKRRQGEAVVVFEATEAGRFRFECSRLCGAGHNFMRGEIVVTEAVSRKP